MVSELKVLHIHHRVIPLPGGKEFHMLRRKGESEEVSGDVLEIDPQLGLIQARLTPPEVELINSALAVPEIREQAFKLANILVEGAVKTI